MSTTTQLRSSATFTSLRNKHLLAYVKLFNKFLSTLWTTETGCEMTSRLIRSPLS